MKKSLLISILTLLFVAPLLHAQTYPLNEISVSYGYVTEASAVNAIGGIFGGIAAGGADISSYGSVGFEYIHYVHPHVGVGGLVTFEECHLRFYNKNDDGTETTSDSRYNSNVSILPVVKFPWFYKPHCSMYSKVALGMWLYTSRDSDTDKLQCQPSFAFQVSGVGVDFGGEMFRGFAELGLGCQGLIVLGGRYRF